MISLMSGIEGTKQTKQSKLTDTENKPMVSRWEGYGGWKKGEGIKNYKLVLTEQSQGAKDSVGNIVSDVVITMYGGRQGLDLLGWSRRKLYKYLTTTLYT